MQRRGAALRSSAQRAASSASRAPRVGRRRATSSRRPGHRRERHGDLQLGIIVAAGPLVGVGPGMVEDVFALAVGLQVAGRAAATAPSPSSTARWRGAQPVRAADGARRLPARCRKAWARNGLNGRRIGVGAGVPGLGRDVGDAWDNLDMGFGQRSASAASRVRGPQATWPRNGPHAAGGSGNAVAHGTWHGLPPTRE